MHREARLKRGPYEPLLPFVAVTALLVLTARTSRWARRRRRPACACGTSPTRPACASSTSTPRRRTSTTSRAVPGGLAVFDYNGDGRPDIFFTNGAHDAVTREDAPPSTRTVCTGTTARCDSRMSPMRQACGGVGYAMGAAAADYDNDGHVDLFVAGVRQNQLLRNRGDGRFEDVTAQAGIASGQWAVAGGWLDYDNDGRLDLVRRELRAVVARHEPLLRRPGPRHPDLLPSAVLPGPAEPPVSEPRRRDVRGRVGARRPAARTSARG